MGTSQNTGAVGHHLTGFDDEIKLGELGEILENDSPVMSIELVSLEGNRIIPDESIEYRWRGVSMDRYESGHWFRPRSKPNGINLGLTDRWKKGRVIRQLIKLEPNDSPVLFGLRPVLGSDATDKRFIPYMNESDGTLFRNDMRAVSVDYSIDSADRFDLPQSSEIDPRGFDLAKLKVLPPEVRERLRPIALAQVKDIAESDLKGRAEALERYLRDSGEFHYSLKMELQDPNLDPVEDFLINRKSGHCEYFASALALMLRSIDIPTRMINGFKGGDYNAVAGVTTVRQKHAHSWVEAWVGRTEGIEVMPIWLTLDPTPPDQRNESVARVGGMASHFYQITDLIRYVWIFYIVGFNSERQDRFLYGPIRALVKEALHGFAIIGDYTRDLLNFPNLESLFSLRGFVVSFVALLLLAGLARLVTWLLGRLIRRISGTKSNDPEGIAAIQFYRRLLNLLADFGLERPPAETPREFARRAAIFLAGHGSGTEAVADVPPLVVDAFYRVRFGEHTLREDDFDHVVARLDALEARLHQGKP